MKKLVTSYAFNAAAKTITFTGYAAIELSRILLITNVTDNKVIYNFTNAALGGTVSTNILTLLYDTTTMSNTDSLQIFYDEAVDYGSGNITTAGTQRVVLASNQPVIPISDNNGSLTVDGTVELGATSLAALENTTVTVSGTVPVSGTFYQATQPVSLASVPSHAVTNAGTFAVQVTSAPTTAVTGTFWQATQPVSIASVPSHAVTGSAANGAAVSGNPLLIAGYDGTTTRTLKTDATGNLLVNGVQDARQTGNIIAATTVVGPYSVNNRNVTTVTVSGTYAGVSFVVEASDNGGTTWFGLQCINNATGQASSTWTPGTNATASYDAAVGGYTHIRVRATAWTSGTAAIGVSSQVFAYDPVVAALSQGLAATGTALVGNPVLIGGSDGTLARNLSTNTSGHVNIADGGNSITVDGTVAATQSGTWNIGSITTLPALPAGTNAIGKLAANTGVDIGDVTLNNALGAGTSDANTIRVTESSAATSVVTSVASAITSTVLKAANTARRGLTVFNNSTSVLYVNLGATASSTAFTIKMQPDSYYEVPFSYNGAVNGIWVAANGAALVTEIS